MSLTNFVKRVAGVTSPVEGGGSSASGYWFAGTWAALQTATAADLALGTPTLNTGYKVALVTDYGTGRGMELVWTGARWKFPAGFVMDRCDILTPLTAGLTTEQIFKTPARIPAKFLQQGDRLDVFLAAQKSVAGTETMTVRVRMGNTGTIADPIIYSVAVATAAQLQAMFRIAVLTSTSVINSGNTGVTGAFSATNAVGIGSSYNTAEIPAPVTVPSLDSEGFLTVTAQMSGTTQTPRLMDLIVECK